MDQPSEPLSVWVIIGAYIMPIIVSVFTLWRQLRKDKAEISQISNDIEHTDHEETVSESQISLEWAKQFKERLDKVETANAQLMGEISNLRLKNLELEAKVVSLGETNRLLQTQLTTLQVENQTLTLQIKALESENGTLRQSIRDIAAGIQSNVPTKPRKSTGG